MKGFVPGLSGVKSSAPGRRRPSLTASGSMGIWLCLNGCSGWRASLDWLMEERNFAKVLNGVYDNRPDPRAIPKGASGELGAAELEAIQRVLREEP